MITVNTYITHWNLLDTVFNKYQILQGVSFYLNTRANNSTVNVLDILDDDMELSTMIMIGFNDTLRHQAIFTNHPLDKSNEMMYYGDSLAAFLLNNFL